MLAQSAEQTDTHGSIDMVNDPDTFAQLVHHLPCFAMNMPLLWEGFKESLAIHNHT